MNESLLNTLVDEVARRIKEEVFVQVEASGRHVHLSRAHVEALFGKNHSLTPVKDLSQPGQFACKERVTIIGPKGKLENVAVLGPERPETQIEISKTDARILGINAPIRESGHIENTPGVIIASENAQIQTDKGTIIAMRHVHLTPEDASKFGVRDKDIVQVKLLTDRKLIFDDVVVRVSDKYASYMHIDYDEANACNLGPKTLARIIKQ
jgi:propanediol utilization protein